MSNPEITERKRAPKKQTLPCRVEDIPRVGFLRRREMEALFNRDIQTIKRWVKKGLLPLPCSDNPEFIKLCGPLIDKFWDAEAVWKAFDRLRGASNVD